MAAVERMLVAWAGRADGYAMRATPVTSAQVWKAWVRVRAIQFCRSGLGVSSGGVA